MMRTGGREGLVEWGARVAAARDERARALRWSCAHGALLALLAADLVSPCGVVGAVRWAEAMAAAMTAMALLAHAVRAARARPPPSAPLSPRQLRMLGIRPDDIDSSFVSVESAVSAHSLSRSFEADNTSESIEELSLCVRAPPPVPPPSPPPSPPSPDASTSMTSDELELERYLRRCVAVSGVAPVYQLAVREAEATHEERGDDGALWWRLHLDATRLTQFNLNLRVWLHITVVDRVSREIKVADAARARLGLGVGTRRWPQALQPFLEPFADQQYAAQRVTELAVGGALSAYRWNGGNADWSEARPTDAELLLHLLSAYLDASLPGAPGEKPFSSRHISRAPDSPVKPVGIHQARSRPPHYALSLNGALLEPPPGRDNMLHALLLLIAALARARPPALRQVHLGPAGLNMLWIIGK